MPTPFQHLVYARNFLADQALPEALRTMLQAEAGAFLLGATAVDVQVLTGQARAETHFYEFPPREEARAVPTLLAACPALVDPHRLPPDQAAYLSGYLNHLIWDEVWAWEVYLPCYLFSGQFPTRQERAIHHNGLRVYLDHQAEATLHTWPEVVPWLASAEPRQWFPVTDDAALRRLRDWMVAQLTGREPVETARIFAERGKFPPERLEEVAQAIAVGTYVSPVPGLWEALARYEARGAQESRETVLRYWRGGAL